MSNPTIRRTVGGYCATWEEDQIKIELTRIRETKSFTSCEMVITCTAPSAPSPHIKQTSFSLTAAEKRGPLARELSKVYQADWDVILEQLCVKALTEIRRGEPVVVLGAEGNDTTPPEWLIEPFILRNQANVIFGEPGAAKSTFALILASIAAVQWQDNPGLLPCPKQPEHVLWLDWETDRSVISWQLSCIQRGHGFDLPYEIFYRRCSTPLADDVEQIKACVDEYKASLIVLDSLGLAAGGDLNSPEPALRFFTGLRQLNATSILLAHTARNTESNNKHIFGSMFFEAQARNIWEIVKTPDDENSIVVGLYHKKPPPFGKLHKPLGYKFTFNEVDKETSFEYHDPKSIEEFLERMGTNTRILELLKTGNKTPKEIKESLRLSESSCYVSLKRLKDKGLIIKRDDSYALPYRGVVSD